MTHGIRVAIIMTIALLTGVVVMGVVVKAVHTTAQVVSMRGTIKAPHRIVNHHNMRGSFFHN